MLRNFALRLRARFTGIFFLVAVICTSLLALWYADWEPFAPPASSVGPSQTSIATTSPHQIPSEQYPAATSSGEVLAGTEAQAAGLSPSESMRQELIAATSFRDLYERLASSDLDGLEPHEQFYLAFILETCRHGSSVPEQAAQQFSNQLVQKPEDSDAIRGAKLRLATRNIAALCTGVPIDEHTDELIGALYASAAATGEPRASAWLLQRSLEAGGRELQSVGLRMPSAPDPAQRFQLLEILRSQDPMAIPLAGRLLTRGYSDLSVVFGPEQITPSLALQNAMWDLVACDFGANCGPDRLQLAAACATRGQCGSASYSEFLRQHVLTEQDLRDFERIYPHLMAGIRRGDWSGVRFLDSNPAGYAGAGTYRFGLGG